MEPSCLQSHFIIFECPEDSCHTCSALDHSLFCFVRQQHCRRRRSRRFTAWIHSRLASSFCCCLVEGSLKKKKITWKHFNLFLYFSFFFFFLLCFALDFGLMFDVNIYGVSDVWKKQVMQFNIKLHTLTLWSVFSVPLLFFSVPCWKVQMTWESEKATEMNQCNEPTSSLIFRDIYPEWTQAV